MIVLHGGDEFTIGCEKIDLTILSLFDLSSCSIAILPTAATNQNPLKAANNGINYFDVSEIAKPSDGNTQLYLDYTHLSPEGAQRVGTRMGELILPKINSISEK